MTAMSYLMVDAIALSFDQVAGINRMNAIMAPGTPIPCRIKRLTALPRWFSARS